MKITLEMWRTFVATAEQGSTIKAAEYLCKSQSAVVHSLKKMESLLNQPLFQVQGRQSQLTLAGEQLLVQARALLARAESLEIKATDSALAQRQDIALAVDVLLPPAYWLPRLAQFSAEMPQVSVQIYESALSGAAQLLEQGLVAVAIASQLPHDILSEPLLAVRKHCVCGLSHPLASAGQLTDSDLKQHCQIVLRDSGSANRDSGWLAAQQRLTLDSAALAQQAVEAGVGFAWLPEYLITGQMQRLTLAAGNEREVALYIGLNPELAHLTAVARLYELLTQTLPAE
ncbi:LysR family transcriptional regulator [Thalassolituus pacificus]|uniref:LysR family transcriptional regulator n=1 Tax=Thalassolituus pacificus TaxID=2975440 RepID=A0A9X3AJ93_9GAMM|nr:LysR family transcriptional regulator [Thalassolituus pacificus]MCT7360797.1 LysR family transcriptional regulator [Thalassolituus pacificus]